MHPEAHAGFGWALDQVERVLSVRNDLDWWFPFTRDTDRLRILDIGGQDINGTVYDYFPHATIDVLDLHNGPGVTIVADAATWTPDPVYDVVMSTEGFEHMPDWRAVLATMSRALNLAGPQVLLVTAASTDRRPHGQHGALDPAPGEHYANIKPGDLAAELQAAGFRMLETRYLYPPGDVYAWATRPALADITVVIPTIPGRDRLLDRAVESAANQILHPAAIVIERDEHGTGAAATRNRALEHVRTPWVAFLDDDDELDPSHLLTLALAQAETGTDVLWPWFRVVGGSDPFPGHRGRQWDPSDPHIFPITTLVRTDILRDVGGFTEGTRTAPDGRTVSGEDWRLWNTLSAAGARFHHVDEVTWTWYHHGGNTSGRPRR